MRPTETPTRQPAIRPLNSEEVSAVAGGILFTDVSGMPDRTVICGTIWILNRWPRTLGGRT